MSVLLDKIENARTIIISGHTRPDGDCIGSATALYFYITENFQDKEVYVCLETAPKSVSKCIDCTPIVSADKLPEKVDLFVAMDSSSPDRLMESLPAFERADYRIVIDHHKTNTLYGDENIVNAGAGSCCEVVFELLDYDRISLRVASALYLGIVFDTGVFKYSATSRRTMEIGGLLLEKGVNSARIIDTGFYEKTWKQNKLLAKAIESGRLTEDGFVAYTLITLEDLMEIDALASDTEGIVEQLRLTEGVEIAVFIREEAIETYKVSLRAKNGLIDVSEISVMYGGGGHSCAAGFTAFGCYDKILNDLLNEIDVRR